MLSFVDAPRLHFQENQYAFVWIQDGILIAEYKDIVIDVKAVESVIRMRLEMCAGNDYPFYIDGRKVKYWTLESRRFSFKHEDAYTNLKAVAFLNSSPMGNAVVNWSFRFMSPQIPMKLFSNPDKAMKWLQNFK